MSRRSRKADEEAAKARAEYDALPFAAWYTLGIEEYRKYFEADAAVWLEQRAHATDPTVIALCDELIAAHRGILGEEGSTPCSIPQLVEIVSRLPEGFELWRPKPRVGVKPPPSPPPRNAWLIIGNEGSWLDREQLDGINLDPEFWLWDGSPHTEAHDLLFLYYTAPTKSVCFVARAACDPFYDAHMKARVEIAPGQWWFGLKSIVEIEPIPFQELCEVCGETLNLKGQSGKMLSASAANKLLSRMTIRYPTDAATRDDLVQHVVNRHLPKPEDLDVEDLRALAPGHFRLEREVEDYIVDPLLRLAGLHSAPHRVERQYRVGKGLADRVVFHGERPTCVIETKRRLHLNRERDWSTCVDVEQANGYATKLQARFILIDVDTIACFDRGGLTPAFVIDRRNLDDDGLARLRQHAM